MKIKFKNGYEIEFKKHGHIWLAESVILEKTALHSSLEELCELKAEVTKWFAENAPEEIKDKFEARLPLWKEIVHLPFKDQIAYREGKTDQISDYFLGDEENDSPIHCRFGISEYGCCRFGCCSGGIWGDSCAVRLCLEKKRIEPLVFDREKHRYARLEDGSIEPLFHGDGKGGLDLTSPRNFYEVGRGRWCMDINRVYGITICLMHFRITEFLEERE